MKKVITLAAAIILSVSAFSAITVVAAPAASNSAAYAGYACFAYDAEGNPLYRGTGRNGGYCYYEDGSAYSGRYFYDADGNVLQMSRGGCCGRMGW